MSDFIIDEVANQPLKHPVEQIPNKYEQYLMYSKMRNQKLQQINKQQVNKSSKFIQLEEGFSLYFNGANSDKTTAIAPRKSKTSEDRSKSSQSTRPTWGSVNKQFGFLTERGDRLFVRPSNYYSDDFDEADGEAEGEGESELEDELPEEIGAISVDLSLDDVRSLRRSLLADKCGDLAAIAEETDDSAPAPDTIMRLQMRADDDWPSAAASSDDRLRHIVERVLRMTVEQQTTLLASLDGLALSLVVEDNWGHSSTVGLTELEFWGADDSVLPFVGAVRDADGRGIHCLTDGKKHTHKDSHMWTASWPGNVVLDCRIGASSVDDVHAIAVWNYNKSLDDLSVGVRRLSLYCNGVAVVSSATVDKALGNRAFNPPTVLRIRQSSTMSDDDSDDRCLMDRFYDKQGGSARFGRRSTIDGSRDELKDIVAEWDKPNTNRATLEQSWTSLGFFDRSHAGRLDCSVQAEVLPSDFGLLGNLAVDAEAAFVIPELPVGGILRIDILSTWGDPHYVGLAGIELFSASGDRVAVQSISANPSDINELPGYGTDPRVVTNLLDGVHRTRDDVHMWLTPFTRGRRHTVAIVLSEPDTRLAMMRIWNYNKSRIHSSRGARDVEISLDGVPIFRGEIARAADDTDAGGEVILFTGDDAILDLVGAHDTEFSRRMVDIDDPCATIDRPPTARELVADCNDTTDTVSVIERPFTACANKPTHSSVVRLELAASWGDERCVGLTGVEFIAADGTTTTPIVHCSASTDNDVERLFDGHNVTGDEHHMWLCRGQSPPVVTAVVSGPVAAMRIWNYNREPTSGTRWLHVWIDECRVSPAATGFLLRRAPGHTQYDYGQRIALARGENDNDDSSGDPGRDDLPVGFVFQLNLLSAWNDLYYVGLNGIELYDHRARRIPLTANQVHAYPDSVNCLSADKPRGQLDVRTADKLVDGVNDTYDPKHMWLAPILPGCVNRLFVVFDRPMAVSMLRLWNYSKSPARGVKDFSVLVDELLIHSGTLPAAPSAAVARGILPQMGDSAPPPPSNGHKTVLFDRRNAALMAAEKRHIVEQSVANGQDVVLINDNGHVSSSSSAGGANQKFRPMTSVKGKSRLV